MTQIPLWRLYTLRAGYLLLAAGLGVTVWPGILHHDKPWELMQGVVTCLLGAIGLLAVWGLRYPVQLLPLLLFEMMWKAIWLTVVAWPLWSTNRMDADSWSITFACLLVVIFPILVPWRYVLYNYLMKPGERWR